MKPDNYKTIDKSTEAVFKDKGSKFIARTFHVESEEEVKEILGSIKKEYYDARHHCYAYLINPEDEHSRSNDDGEPAGTAGKPIINQILSKELINILVVVVRYFGGTKLGVSGLINAYKSVTNDALSKAEIINRFIYRHIELTFEYPMMNEVMRLVKEEEIEIVGQNLGLSCVIKIQVKKNNVKKIISRLNDKHAIHYELLINK